MVPTSSQDEALARHGVSRGAVAAAAKSLQLCPTLCDPIGGSPPGSPVPGILQARTLECPNFDHELLSAMAQCLEVWPLSR